MSQYFQGFEQLSVDTGEAVINVLRGGNGDAAILMLHGNPETHMMWHRVAPRLAEDYTVICPDLRGYGDSSHPKGLPDHSNYSKRAMAADQAKVMETLGYSSYYLVGHDRGARVSHRMMLDYPERIKKCMILDIIPTYDMYQRTDRAFASGYYHWFFFIQPAELPERLLAGDPEYFLRYSFEQFSDPEKSERIFPEEIKQEYIRCFSTPKGIHAVCEDYRAAASIDLVHDEPDRARTIETPIQVLWGENGLVGRIYDVLQAWRDRACNVTGFGVPNCGHFIPEEAPDVTYHAIVSFMQ